MQINNKKIQAFKLARGRGINTALNVASTPSFDEKYEYVGGTGDFLCDLFWCIHDFGAVIDVYLENNQTYFSGNAYCGEIIAPNTIRFKDYEESFVHEMDFDEFLRINKEFYELDRKKADEIWFKLIDGKIGLEGVWLDKNKA